MEENILPVLARLGCYEYLLILSPHADLHERINRIKEKFAKDYQMPSAKNKAHITLAKFVTSGMVEEKLINRLQHIAMGFTPFKVELKDFGSFPSHTIYINVTTKVPIQNLVKETKQAQELMRAHKDYKPHFIEESHITIARKLKPWQYEKGWLEYSHLHFTGRFVADSMLLLKRSLAGGKYMVAKRFEFQNLPVATKQGNLF
jgi:2'-5' RNA ligase